MSDGSGACVRFEGGKGVGMKTVYVERWTDDGEEEMELAKREFDGFVDGKVEGETGGLARMADLLGA